jgi:glycosyltransferase involved in cell wall biosynthesis
MRFPNEKAHGKQVREMCNALAEVASVTLVIPTRKTEGDERSFGLSPRVRVVRIPTPNFVRHGRFGFLITSVWFAVAAGLYAKSRGRRASVMTREYMCAHVTAFFNIPTLWESHRGEWNSVIASSLRLGARIICISNGLKNFYLEKGVSAAQILVAPDGVDLERYKNLPNRSEARRRLELPQDAFIALYNGHLHTWKGAGTLAEAAKYLPESFQLHFMGGTDEDITAFTEKFGSDSHIHIVGRKPDEVRPIYLRAATVTVLPNTGDDEISVRFTSPLKLFGYMAAGTAILASDLPSIREVLSNETAYFAEAGNPQSFATQLMLIAKDATEAERRGNIVREQAQVYGWIERAKAICDFYQPEQIAS